MSLFGFGKKAKQEEQSQQDALREASKDPKIGAMWQFIGAVANQDESEAKAAAMRTMTCPDCNHQFPLVAGFKKHSNLDGFTDCCCPSCGKTFFNFGRAE